MRPRLASAGALLAITFLLLGGLANAQKVSGSISGLVTDPSGRGIPGAQMTILNAGTGVSTKVSTTDSGFYVATRLIPGTYAVTAEAKGFERFTKTNIVVNVDSVVRVDCPLQVGQVTQVITVKSNTAVLKTEKADVSGVISDQTLNELPVLGRNVSQLVSIFPGALRGGPAFIGENPGSDTNGFVNGAGNGNNYHEMNGIDNEETIQGVAMINPPVDGLQEVKITTNAYDAQYGQVGGAVFESSTKSGTNQYHGTLFEYDQNNAMFARDPFTQSTSNVAPWRWNQFGGSLGGPIKRNKLFFFSDYQGVRSRQGSTMLLSLPTAAMKQGDFSAVGSLYPIFDPASGDVNGHGRIQFPQNIIPANRIDSVAGKLASMLPNPNTVGPVPYVNNYTASGSFISDTDEVDPRIDYNFDQNTHMFGSYTFLRSIYNAPPVFGKVLGGPGFGPQPEIGGTRTQNISYTLTHTFGASVVGDFRFGLSRFRSNLAQTDVGLQTANQVGLPGINLGDPRTDGLPSFSFTGPILNNFFLGNPYSNFYELEQTAEYATNWTKVTGSHTFEWGAELRPKVSLQRIDKSLRGSFSFNQFPTASADVSGSSGIGFASFLLGQANNFSRGAYLRLPQEYQDRYALYAQDLWRVNKKLALTFGVRWEYYSPTYSSGTGGEVNFNPATAQMEFAGLGGISKYAGVQPDYKGFGPRLGIAYSVTPKTVFRIGYGRSYFINRYGANFGTYCCQWPIGSNQSIVAPTNYTSIFSLEQGPPSASTINVVVPSNGLLPLPDGQTVYSRPFNDATSSLDSWNVTLERQFSPSVTASIAYVGDVGRHLWVPVGINDPTPGPGPFCARQYYCATDGLSQYLESRGDVGNSDFNSMQIHFNKRFTSNYQLMLSYTWQKTISDTYTNPFDREAYRSLTGPAQWLTISHVVQLPFGPGRLIGNQTEGIVGALIGGWEFSGITQVQSGDPLSPAMSANTLNVEFYSQMPNRIASGSVPNPNQNEWFNPAAFQVPALYTFGNSGLSVIKGPGWWNADLRLEKNFHVTERLRLAFRWDWFNAFNVANLGNPNTTIDAPASVAGHIFDVHNTMRRTQLGLHLYF